MDTQQSKRAVLAGLALVVVVACVWLPNALRVQMVSSLGIYMANFVSGAMFVTAAVIGIAGGTLAVMTVRHVTQLNHAAAQAALEAKQWDALPSREETNLAVLTPALQRVVKRYPKVTPLIEITFDQLTSVQRSLDKIGDIFEANAGIITQEPERYGSVERLIELLSKRICPGLVRIVYQAHEQDDSDTAIRDLIQVIEQVNDDNQVRVDQARNLTNRVVVASTAGDIDTVTSEVETAISQLSSSTRKGDWL